MRVHAQPPSSTPPMYTYTYIYVYIYHIHVKVPQSVMQWYLQNNAHTARAPLKQHSHWTERHGKPRLCVKQPFSSNIKQTMQVLTGPLRLYIYIYIYIYIRSLLTTAMLGATLSAPPTCWRYIPHAYAAYTLLLPHLQVLTSLSTRQLDDNSTHDQSCSLQSDMYAHN